MRLATLSRRALLGGLSASLTGILAACGASDSTVTPVATSTNAPEPDPTPTQGVITGPVPGYADPTRWEGRTLTVAARGGDYQDAQEKAFFDPFAEATGASFQIKNADTERLKDQVESGEVSWDVMTFPAEEMVELARADFFEPVDYAVIDATALFPEIALQYGVGADFFSTVLIYPPDTPSAPTSWMDFWDVDPPPEGEDPAPDQARALRSSPIGTLEFALLADGVPRDELYPLDVERAFAKLDQIRANVVVWYEDGKLPIELVVQGLAGMASAWPARVSQLGLDSEIRLQWYEGMVSADVWVVPRGSANRDVAMDFINYATRAVPSANFARLAPFGPVNKASTALLTPARAAQLPSSPANWSVQFVENWNWWADNLPQLDERFRDWLLDEPPAPSSPPAATSLQLL